MRAFEQRKRNSPDTSSFFGPKIQRKLKTGTVGDKYEVEADSIADKVVNNKPSAGGLLQSKEQVQQKPISETISSVQAKEMKEEDKSVQKNPIRKKIKKFRKNRIKKKKKSQFKKGKRRGKTATEKIRQRRRKTCSGQVRRMRKGR